MTHWIDLGPVEAIPAPGARRVLTRTGTIAVFRTVAGEVFALEDRCPHRGGPLSEGMIAGDTVTCPLHEWCIGLADGAAREPDEGRTPTYPVRVKNGRVHLALPAESAA